MFEGFEKDYGTLTGSLDGTANTRVTFRDVRIWEAGVVLASSGSSSSLLPAPDRPLGAATSEEGVSASLDDMKLQMGLEDARLDKKTIRIMRNTS